MNDDVLSLIVAELKAQDKKWGANRIMPHRQWLTILIEEVGEVARAIIEHEPEQVQAELIQVIAVGIQWLKSLRRGANE